MHILRTVLFSAFYFSSFSAFCQSADTTKETLHQLEPVEIRAIRAGADAPFAKTELSAKELEKQNLGQDLPYLLQYTPSAVVTSDAGAGVGYTGFRIRGTDGTRINVTLNGIPVNDAESQGTYFVDFPDIASSLSSVQIQRGVGSSTNGAGAFGATMSLSNLQQMAKAGVEADLGLGSFNTHRYTVKAGTGLLENGLQLDLRLSKITSEGFVDRSASKLSSLQLNLGWRKNENTSFRLMYMTGKEKTGQAWYGVPEEKLSGNDSALLAHYYNNQGIIYLTPADSVNLFQSDPRKYNYYTYDDQTDNYRQTYYQLFYDHKFSSHLTGNLSFFLTRGKGYYNEYKTGATLSDYGLPSMVSGTDTITTSDIVRQLWLDNYYYGSVFSFLYQKAKTQLTLGGGYTQYDGKHYGIVTWTKIGTANDHQYYLLDANKSDVNVYGKAQHSLGKLVAYGDLQYRTVRYEIKGFRNNPTLRPSVNYRFFNPKIGASFLLKNLVNDRQRIYASFAVANKEPNRDDFEAADSSLPKPERLYDTELGYELVKKTWHLGANLYHMKYKDQLVLTGKINDVGAYTRTNVAESYRSGIELTAGVKPLYWVGLELNATLSENKISQFTEYFDNYDTTVQETIQHEATDIAFSPKQMYTGILSFTPFRNLTNNQQLALDVIGKYVGQQYLDNTSNERRSIQPYFVTDLRIRYSLAPKSLRELAFTLAINNVFNKLYESNGYTYSYIYGKQLTTQNYYYPQAGINWLAGISIKY
jgi:iron complex outermembrane recepter protein